MESASNLRVLEMPKGRLRGADLGLAPLLLLLLVSGSVQAHDLWLEPTGFRPLVGGRLGIELRVGQEFEGRPLPRDPRRFLQFSALGADRETAIVGLAGSLPAGYLIVRDPGTLVIGYIGRPATLVMEASEFERYLTSEGLEHILDRRTARGDNSEPGREIYSRCAKAIVTADGLADRGFDRRIGCLFELVPERDPALLEIGEEMVVMATMRGRPLAGVLVAAIPRANPARSLHRRTDSEGRVSFTLDFSETWLIKAVHMEAAPDEASAEWESWWTTLTFAVGGR
jgi:uncharacterized GH25 family protein